MISDQQLERPRPWLESLPAIHETRRKLRWRDRPDVWAEQRLREFVWSKQIEIMRSVADHRKTAVHSCHSIGKSFIAARIVAWWIDAHPPGEAVAVTSAPTARQVRAILWKEIGRAQARGLPGRTTQTEWRMDTPMKADELVAFGMKPGDRDPTAFQGIHARWVLVLFDEACGIPGTAQDQSHSLWEAADSLIANEDSRFLAIGNPDDPSSEFCNVCKPGSGWNTIGIGYQDTPNFTGEEVPESLKHLLIGPTYVEEKRKKWGETNPLFVSKVLGKFPERSTDSLIPMSWITAAQHRTLQPGTPNELGVDVGAGGDKNVVAHRRGPVVRITRRDQEPDTMVSCGNLLNDLKELNADRAKVDYIGIGRGMVDRAKEQGKPVIGVNVGSSASDKESFANLRAEGYWNLRERFQEGNIDIDEQDEDLAAQLVAIKFKRSSSGKTIIEEKKEIKKRIGHSPDDADSVMLAFLDPPEDQEDEFEVLW